jgi:N-acetyl-beta-hexosaminidase
LSLAPLFSDTGWEWNIANPEVVDLEDKIREELIELFDGGEYFHIGCDEAYSARTEEEFTAVVEYINSVVEKLEKLGRKTIMWGDMLLHKDILDLKVGNDYYLLCPSKERQEILMKKLTRSVVIADWQYDAKNYPLETSLYFKENGFKVLACPWDRSDANIKITAETVKENDLLGVIHTTWNTLESQNGTSRMTSASIAFWEEKTEVIRVEQARMELATVLRKIDFPNGEYSNSGWKRRFL